jgi:hypothetical protein
MKARTPRRRKPARKFAPHNTVAALWSKWSALEATLNERRISDDTRDRRMFANLPRQKKIMKQIAATKCTTTDDLLALGDIFALWLEQPPMGNEAGPMLARFKADVARLMPQPAADVSLLVRVAEFKRLYAEEDRLGKKHAKLRAKIEARRDFPGWDRYRSADHAKSSDAWNAAARIVGKAARAIFATRAHSAAGIAAKLRIVQLAYGTGNGSDDGDAEIEAYQRGSWLGSTIKDVERLAKGGAP